MSWAIVSRNNNSRCLKEVIENCVKQIYYLPLLIFYISYLHKVSPFWNCPYLDNSASVMTYYYWFCPFKFMVKIYKFLEKKDGSLQTLHCSSHEILIIMNLFTGYSNKATCLNNLGFCVDIFRISFTKYKFSWLNMPFQRFSNTA